MIFCFANHLFAKKTPFQLYKEARSLTFKNPQLAIVKANEAISATNDYHLKMSATLTIINCEMILNQSKKAIDDAKKNIVVASENKDFINEIILLSMIGNQYQQMYMNDEAKLYINKAETKMTQHVMPDSLSYIKGNLYNIKGILFKEDLNCDFALKYFDKALDVYKTIPANDAIKANELLIEIQKGFCYISLGRLDDGESSFQKVLEDPKIIFLGNNLYYAKVGKAIILTERKKYLESQVLLETIPYDASLKQDPELEALLSLQKAKNFLKTENLDQYLRFLNIHYQKKSEVLKKQSSSIDQHIKESNFLVQDILLKEKIQTLTIVFLLVFLSSLLSYILLRKKQ